VAIGSHPFHLGPCISSASSSSDRHAIASEADQALLVVSQLLGCWKVRAASGVARSTSAFASPRWDANACRDRPGPGRQPSNRFTVRCIMLTWWVIGRLQCHGSIPPPGGRNKPLPLRAQQTRQRHLVVTNPHPVARQTRTSFLPVRRPRHSGLSYLQSELRLCGHRSASVSARESANSRIMPPPYLRRPAAHRHHRERLIIKAGKRLPFLPCRVFFRAWTIATA
jgi:hypothetical protein